jgi:branched-chain amino acid transport system substrate-binding protein
VVLGLLLAVAGCGGDDDSGGAASSGGGSGGEPIKVAILSPFSGDLGYWGEGFRRGVDTWVEQHGKAEVDGRPVEVENVDDQCDVATSTQAFLRQAKELTAALGPACSATVQAVGPQAEKAKVPILFFGQSASLTEGYKGGWMFRASQPDTANLDAFGEYIVKKWKDVGVTKFAVLHDTSVLNASAVDTWKSIAEPEGIKLVADAKFELGDTDFTSVVLKAKQAGAEAVAIASYGPEIAGVIKQMGRAGLKVPIATGTDTAYPSTIEAAGDAIEGTYFYSDYVSGSDNEGMKEFEAAFAKKNPDLQPQGLEYEGYIAFSMLNAM